MKICDYGLCLLPLQIDARIDLLPSGDTIRLFSCQATGRNSSAQQFGQLRAFLHTCGNLTSASGPGYFAADITRLSHDRLLRVGLPGCLWAQRLRA